MTGPVGELAGLIRAACERGRDLTGEDVVEYLARELAPHVVLRAQLEHVGWYTADGYSTDQGPDTRPVFLVPGRTVMAVAHMQVPGGFASHN